MKTLVSILPSLALVSNLIPPMVMGRAIDAITSGRLTNQILLLNLVFAFGSSGDVIPFALCLAHVSGDFLSLRPDYAFTPFEHFTKMSPSFYQY